MADTCQNPERFVISSKCWICEFGEINRGMQILKQTELAGQPRERWKESDLSTGHLRTEKKVAWLISTVKTSLRCFGFIGAPHFPHAGLELVHVQVYLPEKPNKTIKMSYHSISSII